MIFEHLLFFLNSFVMEAAWRGETHKQEQSICHAAGFVASCKNTAHLSWEEGIMNDSFTPNAYPSPEMLAVPKIPATASAPPFEPAGEESATFSLLTVSTP